MPARVSFAFLCASLACVAPAWSQTTPPGDNGKPIVTSVDTNNQPVVAPASDITLLNRNVGIGTSTPAYKMDVLGQVNASGGLCIASDCKTSWPQTTSSPWTLSGTSVTYSGGSVGVGTSSPTFRFDVQGGQINASGGLCMAGDCRTAWTQIGSQWTTSGTNLSYAAGNVGIGTSNPTSRVTVNGDIRTLGSGGLVLGDQSFNGSPSVLFLGSNAVQNWRIRQNDVISGDLTFTPSTGAGGATFTTPTMSLLGGNVGIGTTSPAARLHVVGDIVATGNISARYQDVAEWVDASTAATAGTVVVADPDHDHQVRPADKAYDTTVAGVVSAQPGVLLGEKADGKVAVAQSGRVRVKVDAAYGAIRRGDLLVTSPTVGYAMRSEPVVVNGVAIHRPGTLIGKALESLDSGKREILVLLTLQ